MSPSVTIMNADDVGSAIARMAREVIAINQGIEGLVVIGIQRRGVELADRLRAHIRQAEGLEVPGGSIDITLYRDDLMTIGAKPVVGASSLPASGIEGTSVVLVDDVIYSGRTVRAALNELMDWGRPSRILLVVLVDRGGRELPIQPDVVGRVVEVGPDQRVDVLVPEIDGALAVQISERGGASS